MSFFSSRWIKKTRKQHECWWCGTKIEAGSVAHYASGLGCEGDFSSGHAHPECQAAIDSMPYNELCDGWFPGDFARGRTDDETSLPAQFSADYRGRQRAIDSQSDNQNP